MNSRTKPDSIYHTLVSINPEMNSKQAWAIWMYIHDLLEDEKNNTVRRVESALQEFCEYDFSNDPSYYKAIENVLIA